MATTVFERQAPPASAVEHSLAQSRRGGFWLNDLGPRVQHPRLTADIHADLVVVGGGYCGLWTALLAKQRDPDRSVVLLEAKTVGWAASGRNGGFVAASLTHGAANGEARFPQELAQLDRLGMENLDAIERTVAELGLDCDFERSGGIDIATEPHQVEWLREAAAADPHSQLLEGDAIRALVDSPTYLAGLRDARTTALVHPAKLAVELARVAVEAGVQIFEDTRVTELDSDGDGVQVRTPDARVQAGSVALATNVYPSLLARNRLMTVPVYDYVLMTEPLTDAQLAAIGWSGREGIGDAANQFHYYRLSADNRILWGGYDAVYYAGGKVRSRYEKRPKSFERLASHFLTTFPQLEGIRFTHRWAGAIDTCSRFCAFYGTARKGRVAYAAGFTGLGVGATRFAAEVMLDLLSGEKTERTELEMVKSLPIPFPPEPLASIGIQATRWSLDRADHREGRRNVLLKAMDAVGLGFDS
ncbi:NAD(P)/FAD-dependent oxidoreductase [Naasia lichenicola]|uniref:FAD-dependent oxidoreductase n=1 Tax=Naasia lichenicola TaxID=2565933 RepID=A0A4S4FT65_9MICO|nr:FAD-dependent oxidoreductase [Naasia lichenicola]THG33122.1 FAD-dependent oxidoreductase [Naasia lichenicola]